MSNLLLQAQGTWQFDDSNNSDLPIATTDLVSGQKDYSLSVSFLTIDRLEVQDTTGYWTVLTQFDQQELKRDKKIALDEYLPDTGTPLKYDLIGESIFLYPTPNYSRSAALKAYFSRGPLEFSYVTGQFTDGSGSVNSQPGFNMLFHDLLPLKMSYDFAISNGKSNAQTLWNAILMGKQDITDFYGKRDRDFRPGLRASTDSNR